MARTRAPHTHAPEGVELGVDPVGALQVGPQLLVLRPQQRAQPAQRGADAHRGVVLRWAGEEGGGGRRGVPGAGSGARSGFGAAGKPGASRSAHPQRGAPAAGKSGRATRPAGRRSTKRRRPPPPPPPRSRGLLETAGGAARHASRALAAAQDVPRSCTTCRLCPLAAGQQPTGAEEVVERRVQLVHALCMEL